LNYPISCSSFSEGLKDKGNVNDEDREVDHVREENVG